MADAGPYDYQFSDPDPTTYRDINSTTDLKVNGTFFEDYFTSINIYIGKERGEKMYKEEYLLGLRVSLEQDDFIYLRGRVAAEMSKSTIYSVDIKIIRQNCFVSKCQCECKLGKGPASYCKHVCVIFFAIRDFLETKTFQIRRVYTKKLKNFHHPAQKSTPTTAATPANKIPVAQLSKKMRIFLETYDLRQPEHRKRPEAPHIFRNRCINFAAEYF